MTTMDDIKDPAGRNPIFDTSRPPPPTNPPREIHPESERRGGHEAEPEDEKC